MPNKSNKKIFEGLVSKTKIYLVVIAILGFGIFEIKKHVLNKKV